MNDARDDFITSFEKFAVGQPVSRLEDPMLLKGAGVYTDDVGIEGQAYAYVLRSPYAHGTIRRIDTAQAKAAPGVLAVLTADDLDAEGVGPLICRQSLKNRDGSAMTKPERPSLAKDKVRHHGEAVAMVVAETLAEAKDAAELIDLDIDVLPAVTDSRAARAPEAPQLHASAAYNTGLDWEFGDGDAVDAAFASAHHITRLTIKNNRVVIAPLEPRAAVGAYDAESGRYTLHIPSQGVFGLTTELSEGVLGVPRDAVRIQTGRVGGSFGMKGTVYPEYPPLLIAAKRLGRPVKWRDERSDSFLSDQHGRDGWAEAAMAFDADGRILAARVVSYGNAGAYFSAVGPHMYTNNVRRNFPSLYRLPLLHARSYAVFTNTTPIGAYRGAGRPESVYYMERLMEEAAREMGIDRVELRRRNMLRPDELPYTAAGGLEYDSGDFAAVLDKALAAADWDGFEGRREASKAEGKLRGLGLACYLEATGMPQKEMARIRFEADGTVSLVTGSLDYGQGHAAPFAQIISAQIGVPFDRIRLIQGDSDELVAGQGTGGSRTLISGGTLMLHAAEKVAEKAKAAASHVLEAAEADIAFERGRFVIAGTDRGVTILELAEKVRQGLPAGAPESLDAEVVETPPTSAFPNGCHVAEVEIDPETGVVRVDRYAIVDDFGNLVNPMLVEGQVHGGIAQGVGQALMEDAVYDEAGQLIAGSFMDYCLPRADDFPDFAFNTHPVPAKTNPLGAKGCGEAGCSGSIPAVMNAIVDVLARETGATHIDMPATPEKVWAALRAGGA